MDARDERVAEHRLRVAAEQVGELGPGLDQGHRRQLRLDDVRCPAYVLQPLAEHVVDLVGAEGDDDGEPLPVQRGAEVGEHLERRDVGAVQVVEHQHGGLQLGGPVEHRGDRRDEPGLVRGAVLAGAELGHQQAEVAGVVADHARYVGPRQPGEQRAQRGHQRGVRDAATEEADADAPADDGARRELGEHLVEQPGLARAGLAGDQRDPGLLVGGGRQQSEHAGELAVPADEGLLPGHPPTVAVRVDPRQRSV